MSRLCAKGLADKTFTAAQLFTCIVCVRRRQTDMMYSWKKERGRGEQGMNTPAIYKQLFLWEGCTELISQYQCIPLTGTVASTKRRCRERESRILLEINFSECLTCEVLPWRKDCLGKKVEFANLFLLWAFPREKQLDSLLSHKFLSLVFTIWLACHLFSFIY